MNRALIKKCFSETMILFIAVSIAMFFFSWFRVWVVSELDTSRFSQILQLLPEDWSNFTSVEFEWLISYLGRTALTLDEPFLVMLMAIFAIVRGTDVVSGEISRGTMEMVLSQPVSRRQVFWTPVAMTLLGVAALCLVVWLGMFIGIQTTTATEAIYPTLRIPILDYHIPLTFLGPKGESTFMLSERVDSLLFVPGIMNLFFLGYFLVGLATFFSSFDRYRWRTLGIAVGFYMVSALLKILAAASTFFSWVNWLTFFTLYEPESFIQQAEDDWWSQLHLSRYVEGEWVSLGPLGYNLIYFALGSALLIIAARTFRKRDIPAPV